jgi:hypothetical protein
MRAFLRAYIDDFIAFDKTLDDHIGHLRYFFALCHKMRITLNPKKTYLGFPSIQLLGQMVSSLGTSASLDKVEASLKPKFTQTLAHLNTYIGLFNRFADNPPLSVYRKSYFYGLGVSIPGSTGSKPKRIF